MTLFIFIRFSNFSLILVLLELSTGLPFISEMKRLERRQAGKTGMHRIDQDSSWRVYAKLRGQARRLWLLRDRVEALPLGLTPGKKTTNNRL